MRTLWLFVCAVVVGFAVVSPARASACWTCDVGGCANAAAGFLTCWNGAMGGVPMCMVAGACPAGGIGESDDFFDKRRSPLIETAATPAGIDALRLYWLTFPVDDATAGRYAGRPAVLRRAADPERPQTIALAVARELGLPPGRLRPANAESLVGSPATTASFEAPDGAGYTIEAVATIEGARVGLCGLVGRVPQGALAAADLGAGDVLLVPLSLAGEPCLMALMTGDPRAARAGGGRAARVQRAFDEEGRRMTGAGGHPGFRMQLLPEPVACR